MSGPAGGASVRVRPEAAADAAPVRHLLEQAFGGTDEADLVERLRAERALVLALVAESDGRLAGYLGFARLTIATRAGTQPAVGLAPLAVAPALQRRGVGGALVDAGLSRLRSAGETLAFVLGDVAYYRRFGFEPADPEFRSRYGGPHFMQLRLRDAGPASGTVHYPAAFTALG